MNKEAVRFAKTLCEKHSLKDYELLDEIISNSSFQNDDVSIAMIKIFFLCLNFKNDELLVNKLLTNLIPNSDIEELLVIFSKVTIYSDEFIEFCKQYAVVKKLKPTIAKILTKLKITCEEAYIYSSIKEKKDIIRLLETINTRQFSNTKDLIKLLIDQNSKYLPALTEIGYRNLQKIGKIDLIASQYSYKHRSETIRVEYFRKINDFSSLFQFIKFNQFIYENTNVKHLAGLFEIKIRVFLDTSEEFSTNINCLYHKVLKKMCESQNPVRRCFGTALLCVLLKYKPEIVDLQLLCDLIYDVSIEIRRLASQFIYLFDSNPEQHLQLLISNETHKICGASMFLAATPPEPIFKLLVEVFESGNELLYGPMHCLNLMGYRTDEYKNFVMKVYNKYAQRNWKIMKECCMHFKLLERDDIIITCLLRAEHLGLICTIKEMINVEKLEIEWLIKKGIEEITKKTNNVRKSGGISQYFVLLIKNRQNYPRLKESLLELLGTTPTLKTLNCDETVLFHTLNAFISIFDDYADDYGFFLRLGFLSVDNISFNIKNCGFVLLCAVFKKILISQQSFDVFFISFKDIRKCICDILECAIQKKNKYSVFFVLFIFQNMKSKTEYEIELIRKCKEFGGMIQFKALSITGKLYTEVENIHKEDKKPIENYPKHEIFAKALIELNSNSQLCFTEFLKAKYSLENASCEYLIHQTVKLAKKLGYRSEVYEYLNKINQRVYESVYSPDFDFNFILDTFI
ncbi:hypothetical protein GINT2_001484 [Glugoides intestinalis]